MLNKFKKMVIIGSTTLAAIFEWCYRSITRLSLRVHIIISVIIRLGLILLGELHDSHSELPYTDIDYKVVTDGARHILMGSSPFARHTYRYSPIMAYLQLPNVLLHPCIGKIMYASFDILIALIIYIFVRTELENQYRKAIQSLLRKIGKVRTSSACNEIDERNQPEKIALASACLWLYNPLTAVISTRGNGDSFSSFFVIVTIYLLARSDDLNVKQNLYIFLAGLTHGISIHLRLYPTLFSFAYFLCLSESLIRNMRDLLRQILFPTFKQFLLISGTMIGFLSLTGTFYLLYGWQYIYETYVYHLMRRDGRHNFSLYFLMQYISGSATDAILLEKILATAPQVLLFLYLSLSFGQFRQTLPFCIFALAYVMVTFNSVVTSQYFVWYLALLPLCLNNLQSMSLRKVISGSCLWIMAQGLWLLPAYLLEFKTWNTFYWIGAQGAFFFLVNNFLLVSVIQNYSFTSFKVILKKPI